MPSLVLSHIHEVGGSIRLILASKSPRRREILDMMGLANRYEARPSPLDESALQVELRSLQDPLSYTRKLAEAKAHALAEVERQNPDITQTTLVLGSDTIVDLEGTILEKPIDTEAAHDMLQQLSGNTHKVHTGVAIYLVDPSLQGKQEVELLASFVDTAEVRFATLHQDDIHAYVATNEPMDKAGSYGIQGMGGQFVQSMQGDFFTVMGLPMHRTSTELSQAIQRIQSQTRSEL